MRTMGGRLLSQWRWSGERVCAATFCRDSVHGLGPAPSRPIQPSPVQSCPVQSSQSSRPHCRDRPGGGQQSRTNLDRLASDTEQPVERDQREGFPCRDRQSSQPLAPQSAARYSRYAGRMAARWLNGQARTAARAAPDWPPGAFSRRPASPRQLFEWNGSV